MGTVILSGLVIALCVYLLSVITDEFFITSLDQISGKLKLPNNVAGASLMAMGSSAPELAIAMLALFNDGGEHADLGIGTIVGSAVFNILVITGVSAIARPAKITMRVVVRDMVIYVASIALLLATFGNGEITIWEALAFLGLYAVYIIVLFNWKAFDPGQEENVVEVVETELASAHENENLYHKITGGVAKVLGFFTGNARKSYLRAFFVSIAFIGIISWFLVESAVIFANGVGLPPVIIALTILAGGTSVPDMISSIIVAKQGRGEMAVANAVGSNIFDILIGLGLPWLIAIVALGQTVHIDTGNIMGSTIALLSTVVLLFMFLSTGRILSRKEGWVLLAAYGVFVIWVVFSGSGATG